MQNLEDVRMPLYEYEIEGTGRRYEVLHSIAREFTTWRELAEALDVEIGSIGLNTPVTRLMGGRIFVNGNLEDLSKGKVVQKERLPKPPSGCTGGCGH